MTPRDVQAEVLKGHLPGLVLAALAEGPLHGYAVMEALKERSDGAVSVEGGTVYPLLHRLEEAGLVTSRWSVAGGRRRRTYALTAKGRRGLKKERESWRRFVGALDSIMGADSKGTA